MYVAKQLPNSDQPLVFAPAALPANPPIVLAATQHGQPPKVQAGTEILKRVRSQGRVMHAGLLVIFFTEKCPT
jgi:hypothetical protein